MRVLHALTITVAALLLGACGHQSGPGPIGPTDPTMGNGAGSSPPPTAFHAMFDLRDGILPYPTDLYFVGSTDGTLNIPTGFAALSPHLTAMNGLDGFSTTADITLRFSAPIDPATLPANVRVVQVQIDNATKATIGVLGILQPGVDVSVGVSPDVDAGGTVLLIHPLKPLVPSTGATNKGYLVLVSDGVLATDGTPAIADNDYQVIRDNAIADLLAGMTTPTCAALTNPTFNGVCRLTFAHLAIGAQLPFGLAVPPNHVVASFSFSTESTSDTLGYIAATTPPRPYTVTPTGLTTAILGAPGIVNIYNGTLNIAYYLGIPSAANPIAPLTQSWQAAGPSPVPGIDPASRNVTRFNPFPLAKTADIDIPMLIMVPNNQPKPAAGWPVVIFQHGFPRDRTDALLIADSMAAAGFATVAIDLPLHGITPQAPAYEQPFAQPSIERTFNVDYQINGHLGVPGPDGQIDDTGANFLNLTNVLVQRDNSRQADADLIALVRTIPTIVLNPAVSATPDFDPNRIHMIGYSLGGTHVGTVLGLLGSEVKASALPSAAALLSETMQTSPRYSTPINALLAAKGLFPHTALYRQFFRDLQAAYDAADPINYIANAVGAASGNRTIFVTQFVGGANGYTTDDTVPVGSTQHLIDLMGITTRTTAPGPTVIAGTNGGWVQYSQGLHGSVLDPSPSLAATTEAQKELAFWFGSGGTTVVISDPTVIAP
jgi:dienelactone hydrolase